MHAIGRTAALRSAAATPVLRFRNTAHILRQSLERGDPYSPSLFGEGRFPVADCSARILQSVLERGRSLQLAA